MSRTSPRAAIVAALLVSASTLGGTVPGAAQTTVPPAPAAAAGPSSGTLPGGTAYEIRPDPGASAAAVALWFRAPAAGFGGAPVPGLSRLAAATVAGSTPVTGTALGRLVDRFGGRISVAAYPDSVAVTALVPPDRVAQTVRAMTSGFFAPVVSQEGLQLAVRDVGENALIRSYEPAEAIEEALGAALFASGPLHDGTIGTPAGFAAVTVEGVRGFAERAFRPANAILVLTGDVDAAALREVAVREGARPGAELAAPQTPHAAAAPPLVRVGNAEGTGLGWTGPPITDEAAATALDFLADALFAPRSGVVPKALGSRKVSVTGKFVTYRNPGVFLVTISGADAGAARPIVERVVAAAAVPMSAAAFSAARAGFVYRLLGDMETPAALADTYGWYAVEGDPGYAPAEDGGRGRYFSLAGALTPASVAQTAARYLSVAPVVATLSRAKPGTRPAPAPSAPPAGRSR